MICLCGRVLCDILVCQCGVETKYQQQDNAEQIEHKVNMFHMDSHATSGLQSGADVKSSAALLIYGVLSPRAHGSGIIPLGTCVP